MNYASGVLILSWHKGSLYCLLGKDHYDTYSDFGGKSEYNDLGSSIKTASRELFEETCGIFEDFSILINTLENCQVINSLSYTNKPYYMYILFHELDIDLECNFNYAYNYVKHIPKMNKFTEKQQIKWFSFASVLNNEIPLRNVFATSIIKHKDNILKIAYKYMTTNNKYRNGRR